MMRRMFLKQCMLVVLIVTLVSGGTVFAEETNNSNALRMSFSDVPAGNWAEKHVSKLALLGISEGDHLGLFNPSQSVMQQDVIKMAISLMGYTDSDANLAANSAQVTEFLNDYVDAYARPYVSSAFREGVLDYNTERGNVDSSGAWGRKHATREWVTKAVIHSIDKENEASALSNISTEFEDNLDISAWALGYVNAAVKLKIVNGFEDGEFKPTGLVTRAQMAAFLAKAEQYLSKHSDRVLIGTLTELTNNSVTVVDASGTAHELDLHEGINYYSYKVPNDPIASSEFKLLYKVYLIQHGGTAYYLEILDDELQLDSTEGVLVQKSLENINEQTITLLVDGKYNTYPLDANVVVIKKDGNGSSLSALVDHSTVEIKRNLIQGNPKVLQIVIHKVPINKSASGTIELINEAENQISLTDAGEGTSEAYSISEDLLIYYGKRLLSGNSDLNVGDKVDYEIKNSVVTSIELIEPMTPLLETDEGVIVHSDTSIITIENDDGLKTLRFIENAEVILKGSNAVTINDLQVNDQVKLLINGLNEVTRVEVLNREISRHTQVEIFAYDPKTKSLVVTINNELKPFILNEDIVIENGTTQWDIDNIDFANIFTKGKKVDMIFSNNKLMEIKLSSYYDGTIKDINPTTRKMTLITENGELTFDLFTSTWIEIFNKTTTSLADLNIGDSVRVQLDSTQKNISQIKVKQAALYRVTGKNINNNEVTVLDQAGKTSKIYVNLNVLIKHHTKAIASISDIEINKPIVVNYYGRTIDSIDIPNTTQQGEVTSVNTSTERLIIAYYNDETKNLSWSGQSIVYVNGEARGLNALKPGDRVNVVVSKDGNLFINLLEKKERTFWKYVASENKIYFNRSGWNDKIDFVLHSDVYIHHDGTPIDVKDLKFLDPMVFYTANGELVEVEKK